MPANNVSSASFETARSQTLLLVDLALFLLWFGNQAIDALPRLACPGLEPPKRGT